PEACSVLAEEVPGTDRYLNIAFASSMGYLVALGRTFASKKRTPRGEDGRSKYVFWPRDLLPRRVDNARIISFGFDADVEMFMGAASLNTIHQHSRNLLNTMCDQLGSQLPIVFVAHSLGGVIVKDALNQSAGATTDNTRQQLLERTRGVIFLGTPHRGSSSASYGRTAFRLSQLFAFQSANIKLITALEQNSETLDRISTEFNESLAKNERIRLWSYSEERQVRFGLVGMHIVPPDSARIGHNRESWGSISGDHRHIAKYSDSRDDGFAKQWVSTIQAIVQMSECLSSLDDPVARVRIHGVERISQSNRGSLEWLYTDTVPFIDWLKDDYTRYDPIFWVTGKPGSGKSTLMRFAMEDHRTVEAIPRSDGTPMAYFFHLRGKSVVQKSLAGMLKELLYQTLRQFPTFYPLISQICDRVQRPEGKFEWDVASLSECFLKIPELTLGPDCRARVIYFVDALDENEEQHENEQLLKLIQELHTTTHDMPILKICLASRPWPVFKSVLGNREQVPSFAIHHYTEEDIKAYARLLLSAPLDGSQSWDPYYRDVLELSMDISRRAKGVFVWVRVVVDSCRPHITNGTPIAALKKQITGYPKELKDLYNYTVTRIDKAYHKEAERRVGAPPAGDWQLSSITSSWLASRTGGIMEEIRSMDNNSMKTSVQFIHQTAQEYVSNGAKGLESSPELASLEASVCGSYFLLLACSGEPPDPRLERISQSLFKYLRDCEAYMDANTGHRETLFRLLDPSMQRVLHSKVRRNQNIEFMRMYLEEDIRARLSNLFLIHHPRQGYTETHFRKPGGQEAISRFKKAVCVVLQLNMSRNHFAGLLMITQNIYYFNLGNKVPTEGVFEIIAAVGPRCASERTDRPRMLRCFLQDGDNQFKEDVTSWHRSIPQSLIISPDPHVQMVFPRESTVPRTLSTFGYWSPGMSLIVGISSSGATTSTV
ncbi:uncharacterized protein PG986_012921, partial [Apiospora aurea]